MDFFDLHCDTLTKAFDNKLSLYSDSLQINLNRIASLKKYAQVFAIFIPDELRGYDAQAYFENTVDFYNRILSENESIGNVLISEDIDFLTQKGRKASILSVEGGAVFAGDLNYISRVKEKGVKMVTLTWNGENELGFGSNEHNKGLKPFGIDAIKEMSYQNILIDISHLSNKGVEDVFKYHSEAFVASHSNSFSICNHQRNILDEHFKEFVHRKGLLGLNFYRSFLNNDPQKASFKDIALNIEHFLDLGGENVLAMGSDFDGCQTIPELNYVNDVKDLYDYLFQSGFGEELLYKLFWKNAHDFFIREM